VLLIGMVGAGAGSMDLGSPRKFLIVGLITYFHTKEKPNQTKPQLISIQMKVFMPRACYIDYNSIFSTPKNFV